MKTRKLAALTILAITLSACASAPRDDTKAQNFTAMAASGDQFEIISSKMALHRIKNQNLRNIAHRLIADHTKSSKEMAAVLTENGMLAPAPSLTPSHQKELDELKTAPDFESAYLDAQGKAHREAITLFQAYSENGDNEALRSFAGKTLPVLQEHYDMIEEAQDKIKQ